MCLPAGRRAKWIVLAGWLIVVALAGPLAGKLGSAEQNDAKAWLPASAESTQVLDVQSRVQSPNVYPAVVVYDRPSGITAADRAQAAADIDRFAGVSGVQRSQIAGPIVSKDGKAIQAIVAVDLGKDGWARAALAADSLRGIARAGSGGMAVHITGPLGTAAGSGEAFAGLDSTLLVAALNLDLGRWMWWPGKLAREPANGVVAVHCSASSSAG